MAQIGSGSRRAPAVSCLMLGLGLLAPVTPAAPPMSASAAPSWDASPSSVAGEPAAGACSGDSGPLYRGAYQTYAVMARNAAASSAAALPVRLMVNKLRAYYRGIGVRDRGREIELGGCIRPVVSGVAAPSVEAYVRQVRREEDHLVRLAERLASAARAGDVAAARALYARARRAWGQVRADDTAARHEPHEDLAAWHVLERALWVHHYRSRAAPAADRLAAELHAVQGRAAASPEPVATLTGAAMALLDVVATDQVTGQEEHFSHLDLVDAAASIAGARSAYVAVRPLVSDGVLLARLDGAFFVARRALAALRALGPAVRFGDVPLGRRLALARAVDGLAEPFSYLPAAVTR